MFNSATWWIGIGIHGCKWWSTYSCECIHLCACAGICCISRVTRVLGSVSGRVAGGLGKFHRTHRSSSVLRNRHTMKTRGRVSVYDLISHSCLERLHIIRHGALVWPRMLLIDFTLASPVGFSVKTLYKMNGNLHPVCCSVSHCEMSCVGYIWKWV